MCQVGEAVRLVREQGRMKYIRPVYRALYHWEEQRQLAVETFLTTRDRLMHVAAEQVAKDIQLTACQFQEDSLCWLYSLF